MDKYLEEIRRLSEEKMQLNVEKRNIEESGREIKSKMMEAVYPKVEAQKEVERIKNKKQKFEKSGETLKKAKKNSWIVFVAGPIVALIFTILGKLFNIELISGLKLFTSCTIVSTLYSVSHYLVTTKESRELIKNYTLEELDDELETAVAKLQRWERKIARWTELDAKYFNELKERNDKISKLNVVINRLTMARHNAIEELLKETSFENALNESYNGIEGTLKLNRNRNN